MNYALIFAGGTGERLNSVAKPKQFLCLYNKPILIHTIEHFELHKQIDKIVVVCLENWIEELQAQVKRFSIKKVVSIVAGASTGQQSIYKGLQEIDRLEPHQEDVLVLVHDGVRPMINEYLISQNIKIAIERGNAISVSSATETILTVLHEEVISIEKRNNAKIAKAPQTFFLHDLLTLHKKAISEDMVDFIDSATMAHFYGMKLQTVTCSSENIKITTATDFYILRALYEAHENSQIMGL